MAHADRAQQECADRDAQAEQQVRDLVAAAIAALDARGAAKAASSWWATLASTGTVTPWRGTESITSSARGILAHVTAELDEEEFRRRQHVEQIEREVAADAKLPLPRGRERFSVR